MDKVDLSLVPIDDMLEEAERRCDTFICAYYLLEDKEKTRDSTFYYYGKGNQLTASGLASNLLNDVNNNYNGKMDTLQKIHDDTINDKDD